MREGAIKKEQPCKTISAHQAKGQTAVRYSPKRAGGPQRCTKHTATPRCQYTRIRTVSAKRVVKRKRTGQQTTDGVESRRSHLLLQIRTVSAKRVVKRKRTGQQTTDGVESRRSHL